MAFFKMMHGDSSNIDVNKTPFNEGWCYITYDGEFYSDINIGTESEPNYQRIQINKSLLQRIEALEKIINSLPSDQTGILDGGNVLDETISNIIIIDPGAII